MYIQYMRKVSHRKNNQHIKDRTESFDDDYFPCRKEITKLMHITNWLKLFVDVHNQIN
jgi:hypothetical protein